MKLLRYLTDDKEFYKKLSTLTLPIAFQYLMLALVAVADALMLGSVEQNAMSAVTLATQIQFVQNMVMASVLSAVSLLAAQYWGKKDIDSVNYMFRISIRICGFISIATFVGCVFFPRSLMLIFTNEEALIEIGINYLQIAGWTYLMTGITQAYMNIMKVTEHAKDVAYISTGVVIINIILNAVLIYGLFGLPVMGVQGAALATVIARSIEVILVIGISFRPGYMRPMLAKLFQINKILSLDCFKCAYPLLGACLFWGIGFTSYTAFMGHLGTDAAAANSVTAVVRDVVCCVCDGIAVGGGIIVGNELGAGELAKGRKYGNMLLVISYITGLVSTILMLVLTPVVLNFVKLTPQARHLLGGMMVIMAVYMIGRCVNTITINGIFASGGDTMFDMYSLAVCMWGIAIPLAALGTFVLGWSPLVVYACTCLDEVGKIPWVMYHYRKYKWVKNLTRDEV